MTAPPAPDAYDELTDRVARHRAIGDAAGVLRWDQEVMMPEGGTPARSRQLSALSAAAHDVLTDGRTASLLDDLDEPALDPGRAAVVREVRREHDRASRVPRTLVETIGEATADAHPVWREAKADADFDTFAPTLERLLGLKREYAGLVEPDADPYAALFHEYEPWLGVETADRVFTRLGEALPPLIEAVADAPDPPTLFPDPVDETTQESIVRDLLDDLGYDWERGRLDTAPHPFSSGTPFDARVTTRFDRDDPLSALTSTVHEFGHAAYTQGLPRDEYGTPLAEARDLTVHESQSRLWENHVGRSRPFWEWFWPRLRDRAPVADTGPDGAYAAANRVAPGPIRVEADELTYHLHVVLRYEIERALVCDDLDVDEVPSVWSAKSRDYLGVTPGDDAEGALQDIHWSHGSFGYFPTYTLGSVLAAQLYAAAERGLRDDGVDLDTRIAAGDVTPLREWLRESIHRHGKRYTTGDLVREATGEPLTAEPFLDHVRSKFGALYDVDC